MAEDNNTSSIGVRIRVCRKASGLKQEEFAKKLGISQASLSKYENGINPCPIEILGKLSEMGWSADWLLKGEESGFHVAWKETKKTEYDKVIDKVKKLNKNQLKALNTILYQMNKGQ